MIFKGWKHRLWSQTVWDLNLPMSFTNYMALGRLLHVSEPQFPHLQSGLFPLRCHGNHKNTYSPPVWGSPKKWAPMQSPVLTACQDLPNQWKGFEDDWRGKSLVDCVDLTSMLVLVPLPGSGLGMQSRLWAYCWASGLVNSKALWALRFRFFLIKWKLVLISELVRGDVLFLIYQHWLGLGVWDTQNMLWISRRITSCAVLYGLLTNLTFGEFLQNVREHLTRCKLLYP